mgnify:FL=1
MIHTASNIFRNDETMNAFLKRIDDLTIGQDLEQAGIYTEDNKEVVSDMRRSKVLWLYDKQIRYEMFDYVNQVNHKTLQIDLFPFCVDMQYAEYDADYEGHFDWHPDVNPFLPPHQQKDAYVRKYSASLMLSQYGEDYEGGEFEVQGHNLPKDAYNRVSLILFPSPMIHRVAPVTKGRRRALVFWFHGPKWK